MSEELRWPPRKEDLERLYLLEHLSAAKIAKVYRLQYADTKTAESTVLYHLKRNGIPRRGKTEHVRRVTQSEVDSWVRRYQDGESLRIIAGSDVDPVTIWNHLRARGIVLRPKVEAQIAAVRKYHQVGFSGDGKERAYLQGMRYGDLNAVRHGRSVRVRVSTTHPAMAELFRRLFTKYGQVKEYPRRSSLTNFEWTLECDLDQSFEFLLDKIDLDELRRLNPSEFFSFLAGLFDAEGTIYLHKKRNRFVPEAWITNADVRLAGVLVMQLKKNQFRPRLELRNQPNDRKGVSGPSLIARICISRLPEVCELLKGLPLMH